MRNKQTNKKTHTLKYNRNSFWLINYKKQAERKTRQEQKGENNNNNNRSNISERKQNQQQQKQKG